MADEDATKDPAALRPPFRPAPARWMLQETPGSGAGLIAAVGAAVILIAAAAASWGGARGEFLGLDHALFSRSPFLVSGASASSVPSTLPAWAPNAVTIASLALDRAAWGPLPAGFRLTNILLHLIAALLVFVLCWRLTRQLAVGWGTGLLFGLHPVHAAAIDVAGHRGEILATILSCAALLALAPGLRASGAASGPAAGEERLTPLAGAAGAIAYIAATFSSPVALAVPVVVALVAIASSGNRLPASARTLRSRAVVPALLAIASLPWILVTAMGPGSPASLPPGVALTGRLIFSGLRALILPYPYVPYTILGAGDGAGAPALLLTLGIVVLIVLAFALGRIEAFRAAGPAMFPLFLTLVPIVLLGVLPGSTAGPIVPSSLPDHRLYLPSVGACWLIVAVVGLLVSRLGGSTAPLTARASVVAAGVVGALFGVVLIGAHPMFANDLSFYAAAAARAPGSIGVGIELARARAVKGQAQAAVETARSLVGIAPQNAELHLLLGNLLRDARDLDTAEAELGEALRIDPSLARAHVSLGLIARERGDVRAAIASYREAIRIDPSLAEAHSNLGAVLSIHGDPEEALGELQKAVELDPALGDAAANLASFLLDQRRSEEAIAVLRKGLSWSSADARLYYNLGVALQSIEDRAGAIRAYESAIVLDPGYARPKNNLASLYVDLGRYDDAIALLSEVVVLEPANERAHYNLGVAFRAKGDTKRAAAAFAAALKIRPDYPEASRALTDLFAPAVRR